MKLVDTTARNAKELELLKKKVAAFVKKAGCNTGEIIWGFTDGEHWVQVENDGEISDHLSDIINNSVIARNVTRKEYKGEYMWMENLYVRPVSVVSFKL